jgi:hypothetical protein
MNSIKKKLFRLSTPFFLIYLSFSIQAQAAEIDEAKKEKLENDIEVLGLSAGHAAQCFQERKNQDEYKRVGEEALSVAQIILQDFGSTLAFLFSANTGYGAGKSIDLSKCDGIIADWDKFVDKFTESESLEVEE